MTYDFFGINFNPMISMIFLWFFVGLNADMDKKIKSIFYRIIIVELFELLFFSWELYYAELPTPHFMRIFLSASGYSLRPILLFLVIEIATRNKGYSKSKAILIFLIIVNTAISFSAFFTDVAYYFTADNEYIQGPLGFYPHLINISFEIYLFVFTLINYDRKNRYEPLLIFFMLIAIFIAIYIEGGGKNIGIGRGVISTCVCFYYMYFQSKTYRNFLKEESMIRKALEYEMTIDGLTDLLNKKYFSIRAALQMEAPETETVICIFLDLDRFKEVNDTFGHAYGDNVLKEAANIIKNIFRKEDLVSRFGGDEFCILLVNVPKKVVIKQLNQLLQSLHLVYNDGDKKVEVSTSIGAVYCSNKNSMNYNELFEIADSALYESKQNGKNKFTLKEI